MNLLAYRIFPELHGLVFVEKVNLSLKQQASKPNQLCNLRQVSILKRNNIVRLFSERLMSDRRKLLFKSWMLTFHKRFFKFSQMARIKSEAFHEHTVHCLKAASQNPNLRALWQQLKHFQQLVAQLPCACPPSP